MSFAAWKRLITVGATVQIVNEAHPHLNRTVKVTRAQTNALATEIPENIRAASGTKNTESFLWYPKASEIAIEGRTATFHKDKVGQRIHMTVLEGQ